MRRDGLPDDATALLRLKQMGFSDARLARLAGIDVAEAAALAAPARRAPGLQAHRHLRRRVPVADPVYVFLLRGRRRSRARMRGRSERARQGRDPRRRPEPHRPGDRVRLLLRPCRLQPARGRHRDDHGQLQPGDRLDRLRHLRPALFRAADRRGRDRDRAGRAVAGAACSASSSSSAARPRSTSRRRWNRRRSRSSAPRPTRSTWPRTASASSSCSRRLGLRQPHNGTATSPQEAEAIAQRIGYPVRDPPVLRARRTGDGDRPRHGRAAALHQPRRHRLRRQPGADRPLSAKRDRGRCRRRRRPRRGLCRRHHGAYRGGRHPFRRQRLLAAALQPRPRRRSPRSSGRRSRWPARSMSSG